MSLTFRRSAWDMRGLPQSSSDECPQALRAGLVTIGPPQRELAQRAEPGLRNMRIAAYQCELEATLGKRLRNISLFPCNVGPSHLAHLKPKPQVIHQRLDDAPRTKELRPTVLPRVVMDSDFSKASAAGR